jgi:hypothetical protein
MPKNRFPPWMSLIPTQKLQIILSLHTRRPSESAGMFVNHDSEVEEIKATLEDFDYLADNGNWGIDASRSHCNGLFFGTGGIFQNLVIDFLLVPSAVFP